MVNYCVKLRYWSMIDAKGLQKIPSVETPNYLLIRHKSMKIFKLKQVWIDIGSCRSYVWLQSFAWLALSTSKDILQVKITMQVNSKKYPSTVQLFRVTTHLNISSEFNPSSFHMNKHQEKNVRLTKLKTNFMSIHHIPCKASLKIVSANMCLSKYVEFILIKLCLVTKASCKRDHANNIFLRDFQNVDLYNHVLLYLKILYNDNYTPHVFIPLLIYNNIINIFLHNFLLVISLQ